MYLKLIYYLLKEINFSNEIKNPNYRDKFDCKYTFLRQ